MLEEVEIERAKHICQTLHNHEQGKVGIRSISNPCKTAIESEFFQVLMSELSGTFSSPDVTSFP